MAGQIGFGSTVDKIKHIGYGNGNTVDGIKRASLWHNNQYIHLWLSAITLLWLSNGQGDIVEIEDGQTEPVSDNYICTHADAITHRESYTYSCPGHYWFGGWTYNSPTWRIKSNTCNNCGQQIGWINELYDENTGNWNESSRVGNTNQGGLCGRTLTGTRTVTDCPANTQHGTATIQFLDNVLSVQASVVNITGYSWTKDDRPAGNEATCPFTGTGVYKVTVTWQDPNATSVNKSTEITTSLEIQ